GEAKVPVMSNVTGNALLPHEARSPDYWAQHMIAPVRFADGLSAMARAHGSAIWLGVGAGGALTALLRKQLTGDGHVCVAPKREGAPLSDVEGMLEGLARIWVEGGPVDWSGFHKHDARRRVRLPGYPFEQKRYFIEGAASRAAVRGGHAIDSRARKEPVEGWFYCPSWKQKLRFEEKDAQ